MFFDHRLRILETMLRLIQNNLPFLALLAGCAGLPLPAFGQICGPAYTVQSQTVMEEQLEQRLRVVYDLVYEDQEVTSQRMVPKTRIEKRTHTVSKPVVETSTVEERYTVLKPVTRREWIDQSYDQTTYVTETAEREETYTSYKPVTETQIQTQNYIVQRPVTETQYQSQQYTTYQPVTTYQTAVVDQGQYVAQQFYQPGDTRYGLRWLPGGYTADPTGYGAYRRSGLGWVPYTSPGSTYAQLQYQPNPVQVAVPRTAMMPQVQQTQVPVQVTRMQSEVVQQQIPYNVTRLEPVQEVRKVPYSVQKPVTTRIERKVPVDKVEWVEQQMSRPKTIEKTSYKLETVEREVPVHYYETQAVVTTVKVPRRVPRYEAYTVRRMVPRTVQSPVVLSYSDPYSVPLSMGRTSWMPVIGTPTASEVIRYGEPKEVSGASDSPRTSLKVETVDPSVEELPPQAETSEGLQLTPSAPAPPAPEAPSA
jgi:hypothetical protein